MKNLFERSKLGNIELKNRFFRAAVWEGLADEKGYLTDELFKIYEDLAIGGVGSIITGYSFIMEDEKPNPGMMGIYKDDFIPQYEKLTDMVHQYNANIFLQIVYGGSQTNYKAKSCKIWGMSAVRNQVFGIVPTEITKTEISKLRRAFGRAALRAKKSGFDGIEVHCAHGYFLSQSLSSYYNQRTDEYGGNIENRSRLLFEICDDIRDRVGSDFLIMVKMNSEDFMGGEWGLTRKESFSVAMELDKKGIDAIEISGGSESSIYAVTNNLTAIRRRSCEKDDSYFKEYGKQIAAQISTPIILVGGNRSLGTMEGLLKDGISYFALGRALNAEPGLIKRWESGDKRDAFCIGCNKCFSKDKKRCIFNF